MPDAWEKANGLRYDKKDADKDPDRDGITNLEEYTARTNPLVSDIQLEQTKKSLFSPLEASLAKILLWSGVAFVAFLILGFLIFKVHIFRVFKGLHQIGKAQEKPKTLYLPPLPPRGAPRAYALYTPPPRPKVLMQQPRTLPTQMPAAPAAPIPTQPQYKPEEDYIPLQELQQQLQPDPIQKIKSDYVNKQDPFERLHEYAANYK